MILEVDRRRTDRAYRASMDHKTVCTKGMGCPTCKELESAFYNAIKLQRRNGRESRK